MRDSHAHLGAAASARLARQRLTAASEGTPEAAELTELVRRFDRAAEAAVPAHVRAALADLVIGWICHPDGYTDPARAFAPLVRMIALAPDDRNLIFD